MTCRVFGFFAGVALSAACISWGSPDFFTQKHVDFLFGYETLDSD